MTFTSSFTRNVDVTDVAFFEESHSEYQRRDSGNIWPVLFFNKIPFKQRQDVLWLWLVSLVTWICFKQVSSCKLMWQWEKISYRCGSRGILQLLQVSRSLKSTGSCENLEGGFQTGELPNVTHVGSTKAQKVKFINFVLMKKLVEKRFSFFPQINMEAFLKVLREVLHRSNRFLYSSCWLDSGCQGKMAKKPKASTSPYQCLQIPRFPAKSISWWEGKWRIEEKESGSTSFWFVEGELLGKLWTFCSGKGQIFHQFKPCRHFVSKNLTSPTCRGYQS